MKTRNCQRQKLAAGQGIGMMNNTTAEVDTNGQIRSQTNGTCLLAADQTWEDCNPTSHHRGKKAGSLDSRGTAENKKGMAHWHRTCAVRDYSASRLAPLWDWKKNRNMSRGMRGII